MWVNIMSLRGELRLNMRESTRVVYTLLNIVFFAIEGAHANRAYVFDYDKRVKTFIVKRRQRPRHVALRDDVFVIYIYIL